MASSGLRHVRLRHQLHQRRAGAVEIDFRGVFQMRDLGRILLLVDVVHADGLLLPADLDLHGPADAQRRGLLGDLVVLRHVRIKIVLPVERAAQRNLRPNHQAHLDGLADRLAVHHRQRPRQPEARRADRRVRFAFLVRRARAEHLRARLQLHVHFQPDGGNIVAHGRPPRGSAGRFKCQSVACWYAAPISGCAFPRTPGRRRAGRPASRTP